MASPSVNRDAEDRKHLIRRTTSISSVTSAPTEHSYEEFSAKLKVTCPTCQGKGKLSQGQADSMVALIPVRDKRLRPRKTKCYLGITVVFALICVFLIAFFLLPRSVSVKVVGVIAKKIYMPDDKDSVPYIDVAITYKVQNQNFFTADVKAISTDVSWNKFILFTKMETQPFSVGGRKTTNHTFVSRQEFTGKDLENRVKTICATGWNWQLFEKFVSTANVSYLSRTEQISDTYYGYTTCHNTSPT